MELFKVIVAGTRTFENYRLLKLKLDKILKGKENIQIVSGGAKGADALGEKYAKEKGYKLKLFPADWENITNQDAIVKINSYGHEYNAKAGSDRNQKMAEYADAAVIFWNGISTGSEDMVKRAKNEKLLVRIIKY